MDDAAVGGWLRLRGVVAAGGCGRESSCSVYAWDVARLFADRPDATLDLAVAGSLLDANSLWLGGGATGQPARAQPGNGSQRVSDQRWQSARRNADGRCGRVARTAWSTRADCV